MSNGLSSHKNYAKRRPWKRSDCVLMVMLDNNCSRLLKATHQRKPSRRLKEVRRAGASQSLRDTTVRNGMSADEPGEDQAVCAARKTEPLLSGMDPHGSNRELGYSIHALPCADIKGQADHNSELMKE